MYPSERPAEERHTSGDFEMPLEPGYRVEAMGASEASSPEAVLGLWQREGSLSAEEAKRRIGEVRLVAVEDSVGLVGVCTAYLQHNPQLHTELWYSRVLIASGHRTGNLAVLLTMRTRDILRDRYADGSDTRGRGMIWEIENEGLKTRFNFGLWLQPECSFIGTNERGDHVRVQWFPGAPAPLP